MLLTLDELLTPMDMNCGVCGGKMIVYPIKKPEGIGFCSACSPAWLQSFAEFQLRNYRKEKGLNSQWTAEKEKRL